MASYDYFRAISKKVRSDVVYLISCLATDILKTMQLKMKIYLLMYIFANE